MTSVGHRTGLFEAWRRFRPDTVELASEADLAERYVREWLAVMTTSGVVEYEPKRKTYFLPAEHAGLLTRAATPNNIAVTRRSSAWWPAWRTRSSPVSATARASTTTTTGAFTR